MCLQEEKEWEAVSFKMFKTNKCGGKLAPRRESIWANICSNKQHKLLLSIETYVLDPFLVVWILFKVPSLISLPLVVPFNLFTYKVMIFFQIVFDQHYCRKFDDSDRPATMLQMSSLQSLLSSSSFLTLSPSSSSSLLSRKSHSYVIIVNPHCNNLAIATILTLQ